MTIDLNPYIEQFESLKKKSSLINLLNPIRRFFLKRSLEKNLLKGVEGLYISTLGILKFIEANPQSNELEVFEIIHKLINSTNELRSRIINYTDPIYVKVLYHLDKIKEILTQIDKKLVDYCFLDNEEPKAYTSAITKEWEKAENDIWDTV